MNGHANLLRGREVPAGYRGTALIRVVLECRHGVAVLQNIPCPTVDIILRSAAKAHRLRPSETTGLALGFTL